MACEHCGSVNTRRTCRQALAALAALSLACIGPAQAAAATAPPGENTLPAARQAVTLDTGRPAPAEDAQPPQPSPQQTQANSAMLNAAETTAVTTVVSLIVSAAVCLSFGFCVGAFGM